MRRAVAGVEFRKWDGGGYAPLFAKTVQIPENKGLQPTVFSSSQVTENAAVADGSGARSFLAVGARGAGLDAEKDRAEETPCVKNQR
jgi:hypothetical protein